MKILWIEDFGQNSTPSALSREMFSGLIPLNVFDKKYDIHEDVAIELPRFFEAHSLHQIYVCKSYIDWNRLFTERQTDFDIVLIDINLAAYETPFDQRPIANADFDKQAGFYIYQQLVRRGFPDENIAFFTGNGDSLGKFEEFCAQAFTPPPKNNYIKKPADYERLRAWLAIKEHDKYLTLRRGVIEGCRYMKAELDKINKANLEARLLYYKTTSINIEYQPDIYKTDVKEYLTNLETFFYLNRQDTRTVTFSAFLKELSKKWDNTSAWWFNREKPRPNFKTELEEKFYKNCQFQMKLLRNRSAHDLLSQNISEEDAAFFFLLAMRLLILSESSTPYKYEKSFVYLFDDLSPEEMSHQINSAKIESYLEKSYYLFKSSYEELRTYLDKELERARRQQRPGWERLEKKFTIEKTDNYFPAMLRIYVEAPNYLEANLAGVFKRKFKDISTRLFYQNYWHGMFPAYMKPASYADLMSIGFNVEILPPDSFIHLFGRLFFNKAFKELTSANN